MQNTYKLQLNQKVQRKKLYENQLNQICSQNMMLEKLKFNQESLEQQKEMAGNMKQALEAQKLQMKDIDMDKIQDLQDEMMDMQQEQNYMNEMLNQNFALNNPVDEAELDEEMRDIEQELYAEMENKKMQGNKQQEAQIQPQGQQSKIKHLI